MLESQNKEGQTPTAKQEDVHPGTGSTGQGLAETIYELLAKDQPSESEFRMLLEHVSQGVLAKRYLHTGLPFVFKEQPHKYLAFRESVGRIFGVPTQNLAVMGSARFGFSTSPRKYQEGSPKPFDESSDMDMVVVSEDMFVQALASFADYAWRQLRGIDELKSDAQSPTDKIQLNKELMLTLRRRAKGFNFGYVNPVDLEDGTPEKQKFYDMKREAGTQLFGTAPPGPIHRVGARIYRDWDAAERMCEFSFRQLAKTWGVATKEDVEMPGDLDE